MLQRLTDILTRCSLGFIMRQKMNARRIDSQPDEHRREDDGENIEMADGQGREA